MTEQELIRQLKAAKSVYDKKFAPTQETVERIRGLLMERISRSEVAPIAVSRTGFIFGFLRYITPPQFAYGMALFVLLAGSAVFAGYARQARPGQSLYGAKIALEKTHVRFVSNPASRAQVQMELAGRRLEEAQNAVSVEQEAKVLRQFSRDVKEARSTLKQAGDPAQVQAATRELVKKATEYEEKLSETKGKKPAREVDLAAISEAEEALLEIKGELVRITIPEVGELPMKPADQNLKTDQTTEAEELQVGEVSL